MRFPCTGPTDVRGFGAFADRELGAPRRNLQAFAAELATLLAAPPGSVTLVNSGSSANLAAALALRERTDRPRALVAGFSFPTTVSALELAGFAVEVIDTDGFGMSPVALERALGPDVGVVAVTQFLGFPAGLPVLSRLSRAHGALVLQDACETMTLHEDGRPVHAWADATTYSFYHPHHLSAFGGGAVVSAALAPIVESLVHWGRACRCHLGDAACPAPAGEGHEFHYVRRGLNLEMSELNACFGRFGLRSHPPAEARRLAHYATLLAAVSGTVRTWPLPDAGCSPFVFPFAHPTMPLLAERLRARGVEVRTLMGGAIVEQPAFAALPHDGLPACRALARDARLIGVHQTLPDADVAEVGRILAEEARTCR